MREFLSDPNPWVLSILGGVISGLIIHWITNRRPSTKVPPHSKSRSPANLHSSSGSPNLSWFKRLGKWSSDNGVDSAVFFVGGWAVFFGGIFLLMYGVTWVEDNLGFIPMFLAVCVVMPSVALLIFWLLDRV